MDYQQIRMWFSEEMMLEYILQYNTLLFFLPHCDHHLAALVQRRPDLL
jgi:hypothetical protein